jgi:Tfp pilus assembly protein PilE
MEKGKSNYKRGNMGYTVISNDLFDDENLNIQEQSLLIALISYYNQDKGYAYPSYKQLIKRSKIKKDDTVIKIVKSLTDKGYIKKETLKGIGCKYYLLKYNTEPTPQTEYPHEKSTPIKEGTPTPQKGEHLPHERGTTITNTITNTNTNIKSSSNDEQLAEKLWGLYPSKIGKGKVIKKLPKLIKEYSYEQLENCINRYKLNVEKQRFNFKDLRYQNGSTFFNTGFIDYLDQNYNQEEATTTGEAIATRYEDFGDAY